MKYLAVLYIVLLFGTVYAQTPFRDTAGLTKNGIEWCEENYQLYNFMGNDFFEHHKHSLESRLCGNLYNDELWMYTGSDRYQKLIEQSRIYYALELEESSREAKEGKIDTKPVIVEEIPQEIAQQQKELKNTSTEETELEAVTKETITIETTTLEENSDDGGGCLIATATYGSEMAPQVQLLREIRDSKVMSTSFGSSFMTGFNQIYYSFSPTISDWERKNTVFQEGVRAFITPMILTLSIMTLADDGSEVEVLGLGLSVIVLNLGMYIAAPTITALQIKKRISNR